MSERRRVLVATADTLGERMAGPAIRAWHIARVLAEEHDVLLVSSSSADLEGYGFLVEAIGPAGFTPHADWAEIIICQGTVLHEYPVLGRPDRIVVADMYDPAHLEQLEQARDLGDARGHVVHATRAILNGQLARADLVLCASERQRDFWLGALAAIGRVNPLTYDDDPTLSSLIAIVPFGVPEDPPERTGPGVKGVVPGIGKRDKLLLWGGGVYNWFDPLTLIRAVDVLRHEIPTLRLLFLGLGHPNPAVPRMRMATEALDLATSLGLLDKHVFANEGWVPYAERGNVFLDADVGVSTHLDHVETQFSFRTRVLDYLWAGLPVVTTGGDALGDLVASRRLGAAVPPGDHVAWVGALRRILTDKTYAKECSRRSLLAAQELSWPEVLAPLLDFCADPWRAPDLVDAAEAGRIGGDVTAVPRNPTSLRGDADLARQYLKEGGPGLVAKKAASRLGSKLRRGG